MAVLDPLFNEFSPAEIAAALSALVRKRVAPRTAANAAAPTAAGAPRPASAEAGFVRLFISIGNRDNIRAGDLVGALTGEAGITGDQVGKIDIRDTFTVVEVSTAVADRIIRAMNGTTMRGRSLRVDYDRKGTAGAREGGGREGGAGSRGGAGARGGPRERPSAGGMRDHAARGPRDAARPGPRGPARGRPGDSPPRRDRPHH
jgi:ATP-dependent RNA helicase DeaD